MASNSYASICTMRGPPESTVAPTRCGPAQIETSDAYAGGVGSPTMSSATPISSAICRALTIETRRSVVVCSSAAKNAVRSGCTSASAISPAMCMRSGSCMTSSNSCGTSRPKRSATSTNARTRCASAPVGAGALTAPAAGRPRNASATSCASSTAMRSSASCVDPPRCGVASTFG